MDVHICEDICHTRYYCFSSTLFKNVNISQDDIVSIVDVTSFNAMLLWFKLVCVYCVSSPAYVSV